MALVKLGSKAEGSIIKLKENGTLVEFYIAKQNYESGLNGSGRVLVVRKACYDKRQWHSTDVNAYAGSDIDTWLNGTYKNLLDADIRTAMGATFIRYTPGNGTTINDTLRRSVFLLSATELGQTNNALNEEGTALPVSLTIAMTDGGTWVEQWTRSPTTNFTIRAWTLTTLGRLGYQSCTQSNKCWSRPAFTLPSSLYVSDDGSVSVNTAPSAPASISIPSTIQGGSTIEVSWAASTDAENNLEGYVVERSTNGGGSWTQVYQGGATSTTNTVPAGTETVMYRVKSYDTEGLYSGYRSSSQITVINNNAPGVPASITIPNEVNGGKSLIITWGVASDPDGNLAGYELERQVDGGDAWEEIYKGNALSYTDTVTRGWASVCYRVRAYDAYNAYSGYTTGTARAVNNNRAPTITCGYAGGADLGRKDADFDLDYSVEDPDGDSVTVTEAVDGAALRTFTAEAGAGISFEVAGDTFFKLLNGPHALTITAGDGQASSVHKLTFTKEVTEASVTLKTPFAADGRITICALSVAGHIPADAEFCVEVTNNANDAAPVWEDCTTEVKNGGNHIFENETAENGFAFNFRVKVKRGPSGEGGYINSVQGGFQ